MKIEIIEKTISVMDDFEHKGKVTFLIDLVLINKFKIGEMEINIK